MYINEWYVFSGIISILGIINIINLFSIVNLNEELPKYSTRSRRAEYFRNLSEEEKEQYIIKKEIELNKYKKIKR